MEASYNFGEATVIPDELITKNCGEIALCELGKLFDGLNALGAEYVSACELAKIFK